jgi:lipopolysaccharide/colanic/teichoic acid biosynthesis glycosyltransferase
MSSRDPRELAVERLGASAPASPLAEHADNVIPYPVAKWMIDKAVSAALLVLFAPVLLVILAAIAVDMVVVPHDRGSVLYREARVSRGRAFALLKFRTLRAAVLADVDGHARPHEADSANLTWVGRNLLKPWYLDELPQLLNVLRGDISLVGPRPWPPQMVERQIAEGHDYRNRIMAGLSGPAQVTKGSQQRYADLDLQYVEACRSLSGLALVRHDLGILWQTIAVLARGQGLNY